MQKNFVKKNYFLVGILKVNDENRRIRSASGSGSESGSISQRHKSADPDPDPHQNVIDQQHWSNTLLYRRDLGLIYLLLGENYRSRHGDM
jgi:hypothetical protein